MIAAYPYTDNEQRNLDWILTEIKALRTLVDELEENIGDVTGALDRIAALEDYCARLHAGLNSQYVLITNEYNSAIAAESNELINLMDSKDQVVIDYIDTAIAGLPGYYMRSPKTGQIEDLPTVILELFDTYRTGITAAAYDALNLTATAYDALQKTAYDYDMLGV